MGGSRQLVWTVFALVAYSVFIILQIPRVSAQGTCAPADCTEPGEYCDTDEECCSNDCDTSYDNVSNWHCDPGCTPAGENVDDCSTCCSGSCEGEGTGTCNATCVGGFDGGPCDVAADMDLCYTGYSPEFTGNCSESAVGNTCAPHDDLSCSCTTDDSGSDCGDNECESGEDESSCPQDCDGDYSPETCAALLGDWNQTVADNTDPGNGCCGDDASDDGKGYGFGPNGELCEDGQWKPNDLPCFPDNFDDSFDGCTANYIYQCGISPSTAKQCTGQVIKLQRRELVSNSKGWVGSDGSCTVGDVPTTTAYLQTRSGCPIWYQDTDGDGHFNVSSANQTCDDPGEDWNTTVALWDCDDSKKTYSVNQTWYLDFDDDGYHGDTTYACAPPEGAWINETDGSDCDDHNGSIYPGAGNCDEDDDTNICAGTSACEGIAKGQSCEENSDCCNSLTCGQVLSDIYICQGDCEEEGTEVDDCSECCYGCQE